VIAANLSVPEALVVVVITGLATVLVDHMRGACSGRGVMITYSFWMAFLSGIAASWIISILVAAWLCWSEILRDYQRRRPSQRNQMKVVAHV
jgi:hypothetical protein